MISRGPGASRLPFPVLAIADADLLGDELWPRVDAARLGGVRWVCLRARSFEPAARQALAAALVARGPGLFVSVHGDPGAAQRAGAAGLHLPSARPPVAAARREGPAFVGVSCHGRDDLVRAEAEGADYALLSPLFAPTSKPPEFPPLGVERFRSALEGIGIPVLALGGVTPGTVRAAREAGAHGVATLGDVLFAPDPRARAAELLRAVEAAGFPFSSTSDKVVP